MLLINFNAKISQAKQELLKKCRESGYNPDGLDLAENTEIEILDQDTIKLKYNTNKYLIYIVLYKEDDRLEFDRAELVTWLGK